MQALIDVFFAWGALILAALLSVLYVTKRIKTTSPQVNRTLSHFTKWLRKHHKNMGIAVVFIGIIHGFFSSTSIFSLNLGTAAWLCSLLLGLNFMLRRFLGKWKSWIYYHRLLSVAFVGLIIAHIIEVGGIHIHEVVQAEFDSMTAQYAKKEVPASADTKPVVSDKQPLTTTKTPSPNMPPKDNQPLTDEKPQVKPSTPQTTEEPPAPQKVADTKQEMATVAPTKTKEAQNSNTKTPPKPVAKSTSKTVPAQPEPKVEAPAKTGFTDGTFTGTGKGYKDGLVVAVVVEAGLIKSIDITEHHEVGERYFKEAIQTMPGRIIEAQSLDVDTVSGATRTSEGILQAVKNALGL